MSTNYKEVPNWDLPDFSNPETESNSNGGLPPENKNDETDTSFDAIEQALRDVAYQLGDSESSLDSAERYSRAQAPEIDAVTREYTQSFTELAQRIDALEKTSETESLRDEIRGLRQRLVEDKDQFNRALDESLGKIATLSGAVEDQLNDLHKKLEFAQPHDGDSDDRLQEAVERHTSFIEKNIDRLAERLQQSESGRDKKDYAVKQALTALLDKLSADKQQHQSALAEARASFASELQEMRNAVDESKEIIWDRLETRLSAGDVNNPNMLQHSGLPAQDLAALENELEQRFESILDQLTAEKQQSADALAELRDTLATSVGEMKDGLDATEKMVEHKLENRLISVDAGLADMTRHLAQSESLERNDDGASREAIRNLSLRLEQIEQERDAGELRFDEAAGEITRRLEQIERDNAAVQPLDVIVSDMNRRLEKMERNETAEGSAVAEKIESMSRRVEKVEQDRGTGDEKLREISSEFMRRLEHFEQIQNASVQPLNALVGELGRRVEKMEQDSDGSGDTLGESIAGLTRRLERMEQDRDASFQPLNVIVDDISRRIERMDRENNSKLSLFEQSIAELKQELAAERARSVETRSDVHDARRDPIADKDDLEPPGHAPAIEFAFESDTKVGNEEHRPVVDILQELTASQTMERGQPSAEDFNAELPTSPADEHASTLPRGPSMGDLISAEALFDESQPDENAQDAPNPLIADEDYLLRESEAMMDMASTANLNDAPHAPSNPSAKKETGLKEKLTFLIQNGLKKVRAAAMFASQKQNRVAAIGAAILLVAGAGLFLFARGQSADSGAGVPEVDLASLAPQTAMDSGLPGQALATDEGFMGSATTADPALPVVEVQGPAISQLTPSALGANAPGAPAMLESLIMQANAGSSSAALLLGLMYLNGDGVAANDDVALWWLRLAAEQGEPIAQNSLGSLFERGQGVDADASEAAFWYSQAVDSGNVVAMHNLAIAYTDGSGIDVNLAEAARLFEEAANFGLADSQFNLAVLYSRGMGVPASQSEAYKWYLIAAEQGDPEAGAQAEALAGQLAQNDRVTAEAEAAAFVPRPRIAAANTLPELAQIQ